MVSSKVSCAHCPHHTQCPHKTRLYINYCGADQKKMENRVRTAWLECRARRGMMFAQGFFIFPAPEPVFQNTVVASA